MEERIKAMVESSMMQFLTLNIFNAWTYDEENYETTWNSTIYAQIALIQDVTMQGIELIQQGSNLSQSKGWTVTSMLARGVALARISCLSLALGSFSDALSNYRMLLEREMTIRYIDAMNQYDLFAKAYYSEIYQRINRGLNDKSLRRTYSRSKLNEHKELMALLRREYFDNKPPGSPGDYWPRPNIEELTKQYAESIGSKADGAIYTGARRAYDLGSRSVHPKLKDMIQPEDTDITLEDLQGLILVTLAGLSIFGLSLFEESSPLAHKVEEIILQPPPSGASIWEIVQSNRNSM